MSFFFYLMYYKRYFLYSMHRSLATKELVSNYFWYDRHLSNQIIKVIDYSIVKYFRKYQVFKGTIIIFKYIITTYKGIQLTAD